LKMGPRAVQAGTAADTERQNAENRRLTAAADGPGRPRTAPDCRSVSERVSALVAGALGALDRGDVPAARALLRDVATRLALRAGD
jgi:hypothetical protein